MAHRHAIRIRLTALLLTASACFAHAQEPAKHIVFTCSLASSIPAVARLESYYRDAFAELGYTFEMRERPSKRAIAEAAAGASDGECARVKNTLAAQYRSALTPVDVVVGSTTINIWSRQREPLTLKSLGQPQNTIGYVDGNEASRQILEKLKAKLGDQAPNVIAVNSHQTALRMLAFGRLTHCIGPQVSYKAAAVTASLTGQVFDAGILYTAQAAPLLNNKHRDLLAPFTRELRAIVSERGVIETY